MKRQDFCVIRTRSRDGAIRQVAMFDRHAAGWLASFTIGSQTVTLRGPFRTLREGPHVVRHAMWARAYPQPFREADFDAGWLLDALAANACNAPDLLAMSMQYITDAAPLHADNDPQLQIAGDAQYGPEVGDTREEGADFNDYLGVTWHYPEDPADRPERRQFRCLDCSGYVRMIFGYRNGMALCRSPRNERDAIPRRAHEMASNAPGVRVIPPAKTQVTDLSDLACGDLVFFDADREDGARIDHVGIYVGIDGKGHHRFISSRKRANGPTMGDLGGRSILDGDGLYARSFRGALRL